MSVPCIRVISHSSASHYLNYSILSLRVRSFNSEISQFIYSLFSIALPFSYSPFSLPPPPPPPPLHLPTTSLPGLWVWVLFVCLFVCLFWGGGCFLHNTFFVCVCVCVCVCVHVHTRTHTHVCVCVCMWLLFELNMSCKYSHECWDWI